MKQLFENMWTLLTSDAERGLIDRKSEEKEAENLFNPYPANVEKMVSS